jgi:hypothetical protein
MGRVFTRQEVAELIGQFEKEIMPKTMSIGMPGILYQGINCVKHEFDKTTSTPSVKLREYARVLKHFIELPPDQTKIYQANHALTAISNGLDSTKAIKRSRLWNTQPKGDVSALLRHLRSDNNATAP